MKALEIAGTEPALRAALAAAGLPVDDLAEPGRLFFAFQDEKGGLLGYGGFESWGTHALMRSLVIAPEWRGQGIGRHILEWLFDRAEASGAKDAWMLTTTAAAFGQSCGFEPVEREMVPAVMRATRQFADLCPSSAVVMHKQLRQDEDNENRKDRAMEQQEQKELVRKVYGGIAVQGGREEKQGCCCSSSKPDAKAKRMGYSEAEVEAVPDGANLGLGCGNPQGMAAIKPGDVVLDLGSGAGFDCFLAAKATGPQGLVIGVDMTHEMLAKARANATKVGADNVEFRLGEIEHLPVADASVDVVISNCVVNLSPDKAQVFKEAFRVLKPGGRLVISDIVNMAPLPERLAQDEQLLCHCVVGAVSPDENETWLKDAGFAEAKVEVKPESREMIKDWAPGSGVEHYVVSAMITAKKAEKGACCGR